MQGEWRLLGGILDILCYYIYYGIMCNRKYYLMTKKHFHCCSEQHLVALGFESSHAKKALIDNGENLNQAIDLYLVGKE